MPCFNNAGKVLVLLCWGAMVTSALVTVDFRDGNLPLLTLMQGLAAGENVEHIWQILNYFSKGVAERREMSYSSIYSKN